MKTRKINKAEAQAQEGGCCSTATDEQEKNAPCCEQPTDGSACCDKSETKKVNAEKTACC